VSAPFERRKISTGSSSPSERTTSCPFVVERGVRNHREALRCRPPRQAAAPR
jgi:hypothetical protein